MSVGLRQQRVGLIHAGRHTAPPLAARAHGSPTASGASGPAGAADLPQPAKATRSSRGTGRSLRPIQPRISSVPRSMVAACTATAPTACPDPAPHYADIQLIIQNDCTTPCHGGTLGGPWPLTSYEHVADWWTTSAPIYSLARCPQQTGASQ